ncbi:MAG: alpha amylase C-terminal domain-containing protein [Planctomycetes bacterium]|nr:alpha amylase C-terminal domain-containing protein [Planctomycetota bacterium]
MKLAQGVVMLMPGIPMIYQGTEWLDPTNFEGGRSNGADRIDWSLKTTNAGIFRYFKDLIAVRKTNGAFRANAGWQVYHVNDGANVIVFQRYDNSGNVCVVVASFNNSNLFNYRIGLPQAGTWTELLNSQSNLYDGNNVGNGGSIQTEAIPYDGHPQSAAITIPQMGLLVFRRHVAPPPCPGDLDGDGSIALGDLTILLSHFGTAGGAASGDGDMDADGDVDLADLTALLSRFGTACP